MKMMNYIMIIFLASLMACGENMVVPPEPPEENTPVFELQWASVIEQNFEVGDIIRDQYIFNNKLITFGDLNFSATLYAWSVDEGSLLWKYKYEGWDDSSITVSSLYKNIFVCGTAKRVFGFDLNTQSVIWEIDLIKSDLLIGEDVLIEDKVYLLGKSNWQQANQSQKIIKIDPVSGEWSVVIDLPSDSIGNKGISPPVYFLDPISGKELLIFNHYPNHNDPPQISTQDIIAIDKNTKEIVWKNENFTSFFSSNSLHSPIIYDNLVITGGDWSMYAFDARTGEQMWRKEIRPDLGKFGIFATTNHLIYGDKLYINETGETIKCLNPLTGEIIWENNDAPNCTDNMIYYEKEDYLVFTSWGYGSVMVLDALTGETVHRERAFENSQYNNDVVYDEERDMFFTSTYKHAIGFKVNRSE